MPNWYCKRSYCAKAIQLTKNLTLDEFCNFLGDLEFEYDDCTIDIKIPGADNIRVLLGDWIVKEDEFLYSVKSYNFDKLFEVWHNEGLANIDPSCKKLIWPSSSTANVLPHREEPAMMQEISVVNEF